MKQQRFLASVFLAGMVIASSTAPAAATPDLRLIEAVKRGDEVAIKSLLRVHAAVTAASGDGSTALHWAAYQDNLPVVKALLAAHASVNATTRLEGLTPLLMACQTGDAAMIELLVKAGANPNQPNALGTTPLMAAAAAGSAAAVRAVIAHGGEVNAREHAHEQTALMFAANLDRADAIHELIAHGADPDLASKVIPATHFDPPRRRVNVSGGAAKADAGKPDTDRPPGSGSKVARTAATPGQGPATAESPDPLIELTKRRERERAQMMGGYTPLLYAARQGNVAATRALVDGGADINKPSGSEQTTALLMAIHNGHYDVARVLVEHGADVNKANVMGLTPLYATIDVQWAPHQWSPEPVVAQEKTGYLELMQLIIGHGADLNARLGHEPWFRTLTENRTWTDPSGATAFWRAAWALDVKAMQMLKDAGADTSLPTSNGTTPFMAATGVGWGANYSTTAPVRMEAVKFTLANGGNVNTQDSLGFTALHGAAFVGDLDLIQYLVGLGARTNVKTKAGDYPADSANGPFEKSLPNPAAVALLEKLGSPNSHNCRSSDCVPPVKEDMPVASVPAPAPAPASASASVAKPAR